MELGEKIRQARLEAGLSQRQLCGEELTRNMLSLIENGAARPSMDTLKYLAARLGKPISWFLEEDTVVSPNQQVMEEARRCFDGKDYAAGARALEGYQPGDPVYDRERELLWVLTYLALAEQALAQGRNRYALELLEKADRDTAYCREEFSRRRLLLLGRAGEQVSRRLPSLDEELLLRAEEALAAGDAHKGARLLDAAEEQAGSRWNLLRGRAYMAEPAWREAVTCLHKAEADFPAETAPLLERCYRELEDYRRAYEYACKQR